MSATRTFGDGKPLVTQLLHSRHVPVTLGFYGMANKFMPTHLEESLQRDIDRIRGKVTEMGGLAERALTDCVQAIGTKNRQLAYSVILRDQRVDELEKEIDRLCLEFLVRQQPVAGPLRFVYATIKINAELERIGDYAESIARQILKLSAMPVEMPRERFNEIAGISIPMLRQTIHAFTTQNAELARETMRQEAVVDDLRNVINAELVELRQNDKIPLEALNPLMTIARRFERVSDQAKNICEEVLYMCTGEYQKHKGTEVYRVLFVDEHNACRSQIAEGIANSLGQSKFSFSSAGLDPRPIDAATVEFLKGKGIDISRHASQSIDQVPNLEHYQIIVLLASEAQKRFSPPPAKTVVLDWSIRDPAQIQGTPAEVRAAYEEAYQSIHAHIHDLVEAILGDKTT
jgi:phosphate transport system protein